MPSTATTDHLHRERVLPTCVIIREPPHLFVPGEFLLHLFKAIHVNDCLVGILHKVLWKFPCVHHFLFGNRVLDESLLKKGITCISDVPQNIADRADRDRFSIDGCNSFSGQLLRCFHMGTACKEICKNPFDHLGFFRDHSQLSIHPMIAECSASCISYSALKGFMNRPFCIFTNGLAFCLCHRCHQCQHQFPFVCQGINVLFLKPHRNAQFP